MIEPEIRWELGEQICQRNAFVPGLFVMLYAIVIAAKWTGRTIGNLRQPPPPPLLALPLPDPELRMPSL